ncbi:DUF3040 domain-containing protein [Nonomuraea sp. C10]|nr:DUF3040 domain-containing protein [Nonomuraea sp. C10]
MGGRASCSPGARCILQGDARAGVTAMGLSHEERQTLQEIEERLAFDDPDLDALLSGSQQGHAKEVPVAFWWVLAIVAYVVFLIGVVMTVAAPQNACQGGGSGCDHPAVRTSQTGP